MKTGDRCICVKSDYSVEVGELGTVIYCFEDSINWAAIKFDNIKSGRFALEYDGIIYTNVWGLLPHYIAPYNNNETIVEYAERIKKG